MFQSVNFECELAPNTRNTRIQRHRQLVSKRIAYFRAGTSHSACQVFPFIRGLPCDMCMLSRVAFFTKELLTVNLFGEDSITLSTSRASCRKVSRVGVAEAGASGSMTSGEVQLSTSRSNRSWFVRGVHGHRAQSWMELRGRYYSSQSIQDLQACFENTPGSFQMGCFR